MRKGITRKVTAILPLIGLITMIAWMMTLQQCATAPVVDKKTTYVFFPPPPDEPRYQFLASYSDAREMGEKKRGGLAEHVLGAEETEKVYEVIKPYGVTTSKGKIYVCDTKQHAVDVLDLAQKKFSLLGIGSAGQLMSPASIYIDDDGKKYVADVGWNRVLIYDADDQYFGVVGDSEKMKPVNVLLIGDDILISDYLDGQIEVWDKKTLQYKHIFGETIGEPVKLRGPVGLAKDDKNNVYVVESAGFQVSIFDEEGHKLRSFGEAGDSFGQFARPKGIAVDREGRIYVVDAAFTNVQVFDSEGKTLTYIGEAGGDPGKLIMPAGVQIDYENIDLFQQYVNPNYDLKFLLLVTSQFGPRKVSVYGYVQKK